MIKENEVVYFLVETNEVGETYALQKTFSGSGFQRAYANDGIFKFNDEEKVKQACKVQNMMNSLFGSKGLVSYVKETIGRELFDENGNSKQLNVNEG